MRKKRFFGGWGYKRRILSTLSALFNRYADTLLNVFLAIAVDNLASAAEMTAAYEAQQRAIQQALIEEEVSVLSCTSPFQLCTCSLTTTVLRKSFRFAVYFETFSAILITTLKM